MTTTPMRLPCRGCLTTCKNYSICGGKPWRLSLTEITCQQVECEKAKRPDLKN